MTYQQHQHTAERFRLLAMHESARGNRRLATRYIQLAREHEVQAIVSLAA